MRIFGLEITRAPKDRPEVWHRRNGLPMRISRMSPEEARGELLWCLDMMKRGRRLGISNTNPTCKIHAN